MLKLQEHEFADIADLIPVSILIYQKSNDCVRIVYTNAYFRSLTYVSDSSLKELDQNGLLALIHPDDREPVSGSASCTNSDPAYDDNTEISYHWYHLDASPVRQDDGSILAYVVFTDITDEEDVRRKQ